ncbi:hypothetical protein PC119_g6262 [Phytophthora cactorum]|uniref:Uncharacterized protein n=3 Tax=Phytophthora cactorum TaxID=29920 RepID=A0A8T1E5F7_9STRA|nr:hypothetical protein GQ600_3186 [Phytophthora cactorum]KAG2836282.1 hypothetical protein PC112_g5364 [Phytophthora cactorum]KAG2948258.1 hypothetical protein PC117_g6152 [Phytophthora cactorum]KAG3030454.1 hypothetical protein PC119_g6262 [Phytophthora cactorum]
MAVHLSKRRRVANTRHQVKQAQQAPIGASAAASPQDTMPSSNVADEQDQRGRTSSMLLWSRITELEDFQQKLGKMEDLLIELAQLHHDIAARVREDMNVVVETATEGTELRKNVDVSFSMVLGKVIRGKM